MRPMSPRPYGYTGVDEIALISVVSGVPEKSWIFGENVVPPHRFLSV